LIDCLVVGGGIAGATIAYHLKELGLAVAIADRGGFVSSASLAAGAFINPVMGRPSRFKEFADTAFRYSVSFYKERFGELFNRCGSLIYPKNEKLVEEFLALGEHIPSSYEYKGEVGELGAFFVTDGGIIEPKLLIDALLTGILRIDADITLIEEIPGGYTAGGVQARAVVLAQGASSPVVKEEYISSQLYGLWGQKCKIRCDAKSSYCISSKVHIASSGNILAIGATHIRSKTPLEINRADTDSLIEAAREVLDIGRYEVVSETGGMRSACVDHFPAVGAIHDSSATLKRYPSLIHGARLSSEEPVGYKNIFLHTGHGSRAFVLAPYTAMLLSRLIVEAKPLPKDIDSSRLLYRYFRKNR